MATKRAHKFDIYYGRDPRDIPTYGIYESAHALKIPLATLRSWIRGRHYDTQHGRRRFQPLIQLPDATLPLLSFANLVEAHVLDGIRYKDKIPLPNVRSAIEHLRDKYKSAHPLVDFDFKHDGSDLYTEIEKYLVNVTRKGQLAMREVISAYLKRISRDSHGAAVALYPYLERHPLHVDDQKIVLIDPRISFGKPVLVSVGVPTAIVADRFNAGEAVKDLADDYGCQASEIQKAIEYERALPKAA